MFSKGVFLLDIEVELAWGIMTSPTRTKMNAKILEEAARKIRGRLENILEVLEKYQISTTWSILGHVLLDMCERNSNSKLPHPDMPRPNYKWGKKDWYWFDPCKTIGEEPAFYGKDIVDRIIDFTSKAKVEHEIACHSFSHPIFGDINCSEEVAEAEVKKCIHLLKESYSILPKVFIFPRNSPGYLNVLRRNGIEVFRGPIPHTISYSESEKGLANSLRKYSSLALQFLSFYMKTSPPLVMPTTEQGMVNIPASLCYSKPSFVPLRLVITKAKKGIQMAVKNKKIFHLFTHDINFGIEADFNKFFEGFEEILQFAYKCWGKDELELTTMGAVAKSFQEDYCLSGEVCDEGCLP